MALPTLADARALDAADPLRAFRTRFALPDGMIYLDGNSLGALPVATEPRIADVVAAEWGGALVGAWNRHDWIGAPARIGAKIARLIGAEPGSVLVADSTSVNIYKLLIAAGELAPDRPDILVPAGDFPTDIHVARRAAEQLGARLRIVDDVVAAIDGDTRIVLLSHVHYRSGRRHDMAAITAHAAGHGARILWDLSHSVGAVPLDLQRAGVELAVGCGYKYLNGGPGAPAFLHVAPHLVARMRSPIAGWLGHAAPFAFEDDYRPAPGIGRFLAGTPPMLSLLALEVGVDLMREADAAALWAKSAALFDLFADLATARCPALRLVTPRDAAVRGSHVSFAHPHAFEIVQALIERKVVGDFRAPDVARFGLTPLYLGYADVWHAVDGLAAVLDGDIWRAPRFAERHAVT